MTLESEKPIGIASDGQLALMTAQAANDRNIPVLVLGKKGSPASFASDIFEGDPNNKSDQISFGGNVRSINLDTDHINTDGLVELDERGIPIIPNPKYTKIIQNRIAQKELLREAGIPIAPWLPAISRKELRDAYSVFDHDVIVKTAEGGFDGRGNKHVTTLEDLNEAWKEFEGQDMVVERRLPLIRELATIIGKDAYGGRIIFPTVESVHKNGMLEHTFYPSGAGEKLEKEIAEMCNKLLNVLEGEGLYGVEIFDTNLGLRINEIAGRTHNTGHWSIEGTNFSQFDAMVSIAAGLHLPERAEVAKPGEIVLMHNLNGGVDYKEMSEEDKEYIESEGGYVHWYHKGPREQFPPRKRGHITYFGNNREELLNRAQRVMKEIGFTS